MTIQRRKIAGWHVGAWTRDGWLYVDCGRWRFEFIPKNAPVGGLRKCR